MKRRDFMKAASTLGAFFLPGSSAANDSAQFRKESTCASKGSSFLSWSPSVLRPVSSGFSLEGPTIPGPPSIDLVHVYYPTLFRDGELLEDCGRWPLVVMLHGQIPLDCPNLPDFFITTRFFDRMARRIAMSGYVVLVPKRETGNPFSPANDFDQVTHVDRVIAWARNESKYRSVLSTDSNSTAIVGHSFGAILGAGYAANNDNIACYAGLSAPWGFFSDELSTDILSLMRKPALVTCAQDMPYYINEAENIDTVAGEFGSYWNSLSTPKYGVKFSGIHFEYFSQAYSRTSCTRPNPDPCSVKDIALSELLALFIGKYLPNGSPDVNIPDDLGPPKVNLNPAQGIYGGRSFDGLKRLALRPGERMSLRWDLGSKTGKRQLGTAAI